MCKKCHFWWFCTKTDKVTETFASRSGHGHGNCLVDAWNELSPEDLYSIAEHKVDVAKAAVANNGGQLRKEPHGGARKRTKAVIEAARARSA